MGLPQRVKRHFAQGRVEQKDLGNFFRGEGEGREHSDLRSPGAQFRTSWKELSCSGACKEGAYV